MFSIILPYRSESDIKRAEWVLDELYTGNETVTVTLHGLDSVRIETASDTRVNTKHFIGL